MSVLNILKFPHVNLRNKAKPVTKVDSKIHQLIDDMFETMYDAAGIGLAATQIDVHKQVIVIDISKKKEEQLCLINPKIITLEGSIVNEEGCLSIPTFYEKIERAENITIQALDRNGKKIEFQATDTLAMCVQHEMDHLNGKLFIDYLSNLKRQRIRKKISKTT
jgi:peptide deformylase